MPPLGAVGISNLQAGEDVNKYVLSAADVLPKKTRKANSAWRHNLLRRMRSKEDRIDGEK